MQFSRSKMSAVICFVALAVSFLVPLIPLCGEPNESGQNAALSPAVEQLLRWLPQDTETVIVSQERFRLSREKRHKSSFQNEATAIFARFAGPEGAWGLLKNEDIVVAVSGCRNSRPPTNLGPILFEGCNIILFDEGSTDRVKKTIEGCINQSGREEDIAGQKVGVFKGHILLGVDDWTFFVANPRPAIVICATDRGYMHRLLRRMGDKSGGRALPDSLPEWRHVNTKAPVWGLRHYRRADADRDPTSPLGPQSHWNVPDGQASGFAFWYDDSPEAANMVTVRYLSQAPDLMQIAAEGWNREKQEPPAAISLREPGVVEIALPRGMDERWEPFLIILIHYCGHAVYE